MKRLLTLLFALLLLTNVYGIDKQTARTIAQNVLASPSVKAGEASSELVLLYGGHPDCSYYVFGRESGGFVIVAAYEASHPVLAYSLTGQFDKNALSPAMEDMLQFYDESISNARKLAVLPDSKVASEWDSYLKTPRFPSGILTRSSSSILLTTAHWDQGDPYNLLCPIRDGNRCVTGCCNTAVAIVMRYHMWPKSGKGSLPAYEGKFSAKGVHFPGHDLGHTYQWDYMPLSDLRNASEDQKMQVAQLMYDLGIMNRSEYGSSTDASLQIPEFVAHFDYDPQMQFVQRDLVPNDAEWEKMIREELEEGRPVLYSVSLSGRTAHEIVVDGYQDIYFHVNFGWGGADDTYLLLTPIGDMDSMVTYSYHTAHMMIIGIQPNKDRYQTALKVHSIWLSKPDDEPFDYQSNSSFYGISTLYNFSLEDTQEVLAYALVGGDGTVEEVISQPQTYALKAMTVSYDDIFTAECTIHSELRPDHTIRLCYRNSEGKWMPLLSNTEAVFRMSYGNRLRSLSSMDFMRTAPESEFPDLIQYKGEWERLCIRAPFNVGFDLYDENNVKISTRSDYQRVADDVVVSRYNCEVRIDHKKSSPPVTFRVKIFDLAETVEFKVAL